MKIPKSFLILLGVTGLLALLHYYGKTLQREWRMSPKAKPLSSLRMSASLGALSLPKPRLQDAEGTDENLGKTAIEIAWDYFHQHSEELEIREYHVPKPVEYRTPLGTTVKFDFYQDTLPIVGMDIRIQMNPDLRIESVENNYRPLDRVEIAPEDLLTAQEVSTLMPERFRDSSTAYETSKPILYLPPIADQLVFSYVVRTKDRGRQNRTVEVVLRAEDGQILNLSSPRTEFSSQPSE